MTSILVLLSLTLFLPACIIVAAGWRERVRRIRSEGEYEFWDNNVLAAIHGGSVQ